MLYTSAISAVVVLLLVLTAADSYLRATATLMQVGDQQTPHWLATYGSNPVTSTPTLVPTPSGPVRARLYVPEGVQHPGALVLLHGVHHLGIEEPRLVRFSRAMASHGIVVLTPELADLADYHVSPHSIEVIGAAAKDLRERSGANSVAVLGLSFAGGLAVVAAEDPQYAKDISMVVSIGGHDDLSRVLRFFATNTVEQPDGSRSRVQAHEYGVLVVAYAHPEDFFPAKDVELAHDALRQQLWENMEAAQSISQRMSPAGQARMKELLNHHTEVLSRELLAAIEKHSATERAVSPSANIAQLRAPVMLLHGAGDNVIPPAETEWLARSVPSQLLIDSLVSPAVSHVEVGGKPTFGDRLKLVNFISTLLHEVDQRARTTKQVRALDQQRFSVPQVPGTQPWSR